MKTAGFQLKLQFKNEVFEGSMLELASMIRGAKKNIYEIFILQIIEQFITYIKSLEAINLEDSGSFINFASELLLIKSRLLLPHDSDANPDERKELTQRVVEQILEFEEIKMSAETLETLQDFETHIVERKDKQRLLPLEEKEEEDGWKEVELYDLISAFARLVYIVDETELSAMEMNRFTIEDAVTMIQVKLKDRGQFDFIELFEERTSRKELVTFFIAILELVRNTEIVLKQQSYFESIFICRS